MKRITEFTFYNFEAVLDSLKFPEKNTMKKKLIITVCALLLGASSLLAIQNLPENFTIFCPMCKDRHIKTEYNETTHSTHCTCEVCGWQWDIPDFLPNKE